MVQSYLLSDTNVPFQCINVLHFTVTHDTCKQGEYFQIAAMYETFTATLNTKLHNICSIERDCQTTWSKRM